MTKSGTAVGPRVFENVVAARQDAALNFMGAQALSPKWQTLPGSRPVRLAELRTSMCRWPIGDPQQHEVFRFCGSNCQSGDSYCADHKKMAFAPSKAARSNPISADSPAMRRSKA
jgi:hypothetical protein